MRSSHPRTPETQMRKLKIIEHISLDGVIQVSGEDGDFPYGEDGWLDVGPYYPCGTGVRRNAIDYLDLLRTNLQPGRTEDWASKPTHALKV